jgi:hypothetical protein
MSAVIARVHRAIPLPKVPTYIGACCREWVLALGYRGRCGLCSEVPTYLRPDEGAT